MPPAAASSPGLPPPRQARSANKNCSDGSQQPIAVVRARLGASEEQVQAGSPQRLQERGVGKAATHKHPACRSPARPVLLKTQ